MLTWPGTSGSKLSTRRLRVLVSRRVTREWNCGVGIVAWQGAAEGGGSIGFANTEAADHHAHRQTQQGALHLPDLPAVAPGQGAELEPHDER